MAKKQSMPGLSTLKRLSLAFGLCFFLLDQSAHALQPGWYLGGGYGLSHLDPEIPFDILEASETSSELARLFAGYDFSQTTSLELVLSDLGKAELSNQDQVEYAAADIVGLYRFYDYLSWHPGNRFPDLRLFGKLGLGYLHVDSDTALESESRVHMTLGVGAELEIFGGLAVRTDLEFIDSDAQAVSVSLLKRFGGKKKSPPGRDTQIPPGGISSVGDENDKVQALETPSSETGKAQTAATNSDGLFESQPLPAPMSIPKPTAMTGDVDGDEVLDSEDQCLNSRPGYPVRENGCALLEGILANMPFDRYSSVLNQQIKNTLNGLVNILKKYPQTRIQLSSHTAAERSEQQQIELTRIRLRNIALYLRDNGIGADRVKFLAYGARAAVPVGKSADRIEIKELP